MANVPGLPQDQSSGLKAAKQRVMVDNPIKQLPGLRPVAAPVDTYSRPAQPQSAQLADALSFFNNALVNFGSAKLKYDKENPDTLAGLEADYAKMKPGEFAQRAAAGTLSQPWYTAAGKERMGEKLGIDHANDLKLKYATEFVGSGQDFDTWLSEQNAAFYEVNKDSIVVTSAQPYIDDAVQSIRADNGKNLAAADLDNKASATLTVWSDKVQKGIEAKQSPEEIAKSVFSDAQFNQQMLGIDPLKQSDIAFTLVQNAANLGTPEGFAVARAMLTQPFTINGQSRTLLTDSQTSATANNLMGNIAEQEHKYQLKQQAAASEGQMTSQLRNEVLRGTLSLQDEFLVYAENGSQKRVTAEEISRRGSDIIKQEASNLRQQNGWTDQQQLDYEIEMHARNGIRLDTVDRVLKGGVLGANMAGVSQDQIPAGLEAGYQTYERILSTNPAYLNGLPKNVSDTYEMVRIGVQENGQDLQTAYKAAVTAISSDADQTHIASISEKEVQKRADSLDPYWFHAAPENKQAYADYVRRNGQYYARLGMSPNEALDLADKRFKESHIDINGFWVDASDKGITPTFKDDVMYALQQKADENKDDGIEIDDLSIEPVYGQGSTGAWHIVVKGTRIPVGTLTTRSLADISKQRRNLAISNAADANTNK